MKTKKNEIQMEEKKIKKLQEEIKELEQRLKDIDIFTRRTIIPMVPVKSKGYWKPSSLIVME